MAIFTGTDADEIITPQFVSPTVVATGGIRPSNASDVIDGGAGNDTIDGGGGDDTIRGGDGNDLLIGGAGNDTIIGGRGNDVALLGAGDDLFIWNPGEGSDVVEGGGGFDTLDFVGANASENVSISANGGRVTFSRDVGNVTMDLNGVERIQFEAAGGADNVVVNDLSGTDVKQVAINLAALGTTSGDGQPDTVTINARDAKDKISIVSTGGSVIVNGLSEQVTIDGAEAANDKLVINGLGGNDTIDASGLRAGLINLVIDGGDGNDRIIGSGAADKLIGGSGDDVVTGGVGNDVALLGDGNDRFIWNPGDGSDVVDGGAGFDTLDFRGSDASETFTISANGARALFVRDVGNVTMDLNGVERIQLAANGGADTIIINDLAGTDVKEVAIDLAAAGTSKGDGQSDQVIVNGTAGNDDITIGHHGGAVTVSGLAETVSITHADGLDQLKVSAGAGDDVIDASGLPANHIGLILDGGAGNDTILGSHGNDTVIGGTGNDVAFLGAGDDLFIWNPGDGSDVVEGGAGFDTLDFRGANASENVSISAQGDHALFLRDVANITMDLHGIERIQFEALGGTDNILVNDLAATDVKEVAIDLAGAGGTGDGEADTVTVNATDGADRIGVLSSGASVLVNGLPEQVTIDGAEGANDSLTIKGLGGNDTIDASGLNAGQIKLVIDGGAGNDTITGSRGDDVLIGGAGDDKFVFAFGQTGHDVIRDFQAHGTGTQGDTVALAGFSDHTFEQAVADGHIAQGGADVAISDGTSIVATLQNVSLASLHANDFLFT